MNHPPTAAARRFLRTGVALLALLAGLLVPAAAEQPTIERAAGDGPSSAVQFRRVYIPEDQIDQWPRHGVRYLPMDAAEFERLAGNLPATTQAAAIPAVQPPNVEVIRAVYEAQLAGDVLTLGQATLQIRDADKSPALMRLDPCRLPIQSPRWLAGQSVAEVAPATAATTTGAPTASQPAMLGVGADGNLVLRVEQSGTLRFDWSLIGRRETGAALVFDLGLPPAPSNELRLALPAELVPSVDQGFVTLVAADKADTAAASAAAANGPSAKASEKPLRHWNIELGGQTRIVVRLSRHDFLRESRPLTLVRQSLIYDFSPRGMQLSADLKLDVLGEPIQRIALLVDQPLALVTARYGGTPLPWFETDAAGRKIASADSHGHRSAATEASSPAASDRTGMHRVVLEIPEPLHGTGRVLRLGFVAPLVARGRLPTVRPADDGLFWQEGSASLLVPLPLELDELTLRGCRQTKAELLPAPSVGDAIGLQYFRPDADVNVGIERRAERLQVNSGTMIDVRGGTMTGRFLADVTVQDGECFKLSADVSPSWIIDAVETVPADSLADWSYSPGTGLAAQLEIGLAKSIRPDRPLRLVVSGRWRRAPRGEQLRPKDIEMVTLRDATAARRVAAIRPAAPYRLQTSGAEGLHRLDPARLTTADAALLGGAPIADGALVLVDDEAAEDLAATVTNETPLFSGTVHLDAQVADTSLTESYRLRCKPESAELNRLLVHFSRRRDEPLHWNLVTADNEGAVDTAPSTANPDLQDRFTARRLSAAQQAALGTSGEVWELTFRQPGSKPLEIRAIRNSTLSADTPLSLAELVHATEQQGSVAIWATGRRIPRINNRRLKPIPIDPAAIDSPPRTADAPPHATDAPPRAADASLRSATELAAFQYEPVDEIISATVDPTASLTVSPGTERPAAWSWSCRLDSYFSPDGSSQHLGCWRIENTGRTRVRFQMPLGAIFRTAWIDDSLCTAGALSTDSASAGAMSVDPAVAAGNRAKVGDQAATNTAVKLELPAGRRFVRVALQWSSSDGPLSIFSSRTSQLPEIDMPVMARQWHVWLAPRYRLNNPDTDSQSALTAPVSWNQRLFGPFGKPPGEVALNPLRSDEWVGMARRLASYDPAWSRAQEIVDRLAQRAKAGSPAPGIVRAASSKRETASATNISGTSSPANPSATTWGELLADAQSDSAPPSDVRPLPLLVDTRALADIGLSAQSPVRFPSPNATNGWPFAQADLALLIDPRAIVLTSRSATAVWTGPWSTAESILQRAPRGPFDQQLQQALMGNSERFVPVELWHFPADKSPWAMPSLVGDAPAIDHAGWTVYDIDLTETSRQVGIVDRDLMLVIGCGLFLLTALLVFAKGDVSWNRQGIVFTSATAIALLLPGSCAPLGAGLWLGLAAGWTLRWLARWDRPLGAYSLRLLAAAAGSGTASVGRDVSPIDGPAGDSGDATLPSAPIESFESMNQAVRGDSKSHRGTAARPTSSGSSIRKRGGPAGPLGLLLVLGCLAWHDASAAEPEAGGAPASSAQTGPAKPQASSGAVGEVDNIPEVLIPTDDQQHLKGKVYLVPEGLYRDLVRRGERSSKSTSENWLIATAKYQGGLTRQGKTAALDTTNWSATYDLDVLSSPAHVCIPLGDSTTNFLPVNLLPDGVHLDGQPIQFQWEAGKQGTGVRGQGSAKGSDAAVRSDYMAAAGQRGVAFDVSAVGHHKVELAFRPTPQKLADETTLDFAILPLATSRLELSMPADVPVEVPGAEGQPSLDQPHGRLTVSLGPIDRLTVRGWSDPAGGGVKPPVVDVDELYWLKVRPGSVVLEARFNLRVAEGKLTQLRLLEDPRLRRLPLESGSPISEVRTEEGDLHTIYVGLAQAVVDRTTFTLSFLLTDTSGIGNLRLPKLEAVGVRSQNRQLAVSVEPPLAFDPPSAATAAAAPAAAPLTAAQFLSAWGPADAKPQLACKLPPGDITWSLPIYSRQPQLESREQLAIAVQRGRLHETWLADLTAVGGTVFQIQLTAPPQWVVEQALFRQEGSPDQTVRWARAPGGGLTLFLPGPAPEQSQLLLRGSMPYTPGAVTTLPMLRVAGPSTAKVPSQTILLLRGADVQLTVTNAAGMQRSGKSMLQTAVDQALADGLLDRIALTNLRPAAHLSGHTTAGAGPAIQIAANVPHVDGKEMTTIRRVDDAWTAAVDLDLDVSGGILDGLRFDLPPQWSEPTEITPATPHQLIDVPGENRRQLVLRPAEPWSGTVHLHLSGPMITPAGQRVRVPDVRPLGVAQLHRYVLLPTRSGEQNLSWEASGLNFEPLPKRFTAESSQLDLYRTCEVVAEHFEATLKSVEKTIGQPRVRLADIAVACSDGGHCYGTATFDLEPAGALNCLLELAPNERLIHVRADGLAAAARPVGENHWSVALGDGKLPQQMEIVFTADLPSETAGNGRLLLSAPVLVDLPVEQTLWSVIAAGDGTAMGSVPTGGNATGSGPIGGTAVAGAAPATDIHQDLIRLETISQLLESAGSAPAVEADDQTAGWFAAWTNRLLVARGAVDRWRAREGDSEASRAAVEETQAIDARQTKLTRRLGIGNLIAEQSAARPVADEAFDLWTQTDRDARPVAGYYVHGFGPTLALALPRRGLSDSVGRLFTAILGATIVGLVFWFGGRPSPWSDRWYAIVGRPTNLGAAAGLFWWLEMEPSWLGLVLLVVSLIALLRSRRFSRENAVETAS